MKVKDNAACPYCQSHRQTIHHLFINCILCIVSWSDGLGAGHLTIIVGNGRRGFFKRKLPAGPAMHLTNLFQMPRGGLELTESHINPLNCSGRSSKYGGKITHKTSSILGIPRKGRRMFTFIKPFVYRCEILHVQCFCERHVYYFVEFVNIVAF